MKQSSFNSGIFIALVFSILCFIRASAQVSQIEDPIISHKNFISIGAGFNNVSPNLYYEGGTALGKIYEVVSGINDIHASGSIQIGHCFTLKGKSGNFAISINTGASIMNYSLMGIGVQIAGTSKYYNSNSIQKFEETDIQFPLIIGYRIPLKIMQPQSRYHSLEIRAGAAYVVNTHRQMEEVVTATGPAGAKDFPSNQFEKFNLQAEVGFSFLSASGQGHKFGIRGTYDTGYYLSKSTTEVPFIYNSIGVFYDWTFLTF